MKRAVCHPLTWFATTLAIVAILGVSGLRRGSQLEGYVFGYIAAVWVGRDSVRTRRLWPTDLTMIFYPFMLPAYLIASRGWKGVVIGIAMIGSFAFVEWLAHRFS